MPQMKILYNFSSSEEEKKPGYSIQSDISGSAYIPIFLFHYEKYPPIE
jgi:hypothetical protein